MSLLTKRPRALCTLLAGAAMACAILGLGADRVAAEPLQVEINPQERFQNIEGWGTCLVAWVEDMRQLYRTPEFQKQYVEDMGANMVRINLWGPVHDEAVENPEDIRWQDFDFEVSGGRPQIFIDFGKETLKLNPEMKFIGSVWSPPVWMKIGKSLTDPKGSGAIRGNSYERNDRVFDNRVDPKYFEHFAQWVVEMVKYHDEQGVPLYAVSPSNEPQFTQGFESCVWTPEDLVTVTKMIRERLDAQGYEDVKIFVPETMTGHIFAGGTTDYIDAFKAEDVAEDFEVWATHGYTDGVQGDVSANSSAQFWNLIKDTGKPYWVTEGGTGGHEWPQPLEGMAAMLHNALVWGHASAVVPWQITGHSPTQHNIMLMTEIGKKANAARQYWHFIRPGAVRIAATPSEGGEDQPVMTSAFLHEENGTLTLVLVNMSESEQEVEINLGSLEVSAMTPTRTSESEDFAEQEAVNADNGTLTTTLPAQSITTFQGQVGSGQ